MIRNPKLGWLVAIALLSAACGGKTTLGDAPSDQGDAGEAGSGGTAGSGGGTGGTGGVGGGSGGSGGTAGTGGVGGFGGSVGGSGGTAGFGGSTGGSGGTAGTGGAAGTGGTIACGQTYEKFDVEAKVYDGSFWGCWSGGGGTLELEGIVLDPHMNGFRLDSCPPDLDCAGGMSSDFFFWAEGLQAYVPPGAFVHVTLSINMPWGCEQRILVRNLPEWEGVPNPVSSGRDLYLVGADGTLATLPQTPFEISADGLGCYPGAPSCGVEADDYVLGFYAKNGPTNPGVTVGMGQQVEWTLPDPNGMTQYLTVRNLRSYVSGACDDDWNWAYWVAPALYEPFDQ